MGQQPNIELDIDDLPRDTHEPGAPSGWKPTRPGEILSPAAMPVGGVFGNPSPDGGISFLFAHCCWDFLVVELAQSSRMASSG